MHERSLFLRALEIENPAERTDVLARECPDAAVRERVERLLAAHIAASGILDRPAVEPAATVAFRSMTESPGTQIGPYKLLQQIGEGGFGVVFMAEQLEPVRRKVAVKVIKPGMDTRQVIARFEAERQALAVMDHPNIARVLDAGATESGRPYFVMELVRGTPITQYCDENSLPVRERLALFAAVCQAIQHAHTKGIIHRDIKPTNVLVTRQDGQSVVKVIDFGIAKAMGQQLTDKTLFTDFAQMIGTPLYMSPEQAELSSSDIDTRSDIYSLGVLLYELLTGSTPVSKEQLKQAAFDEIRRIIREDEAERPSTRISSAEAAPSIAAQRHTEPAKLARLVRGELDWIVMKALEKDRGRRYETASGFAADVQRYLNDEQVQACPPSAWYRFRKSARRNRVALTVTAIVAAALLLGIVGTTWQAIRASGQRDRAVAAEILAGKRLESVTRARQDADEQRRLAVNNADEAARNLREARQAVDDWFTKISQSTLLEAPGLQPLRKELLEAALTYYQGLLQQSQNHPELRADVAAAQMRLAVIYISFDRNDDSLAAMLQGLELVEQLIRERPDDTELPKRLAGYFKWSRDLYARTRLPSDPPKAIATLERAAEIWQQFIRDNPTLPELQGDLAGIYLLLSAINQSRDVAQSLAFSEKSLGILEKLVRARPDLDFYHDALVLNFDENAYVLIRQGKAEAAEQLGRRAVRYFEEVSRDHPAALSPRLSLARVQQALAYKIRLDRPSEAEGIFRQEVAGLEKLLVESPANPHVRQQLYLALDSLVSLLEREGRDAAADELRDRAQLMIERLILDYPDAADYRDRFAKSIAVRANRLIASHPDQLEEPEQLYRRALAVQEQLVVDFPDQVRFAEDLAGTQRRLLDVLRTRGSMAGIIDLHRQMIAHSEWVAEQFPQEANHHRELAKSHNRLGLVLRDAGQAAEAEVELLKAQELWKSRESAKVDAARKAAEADPKNVHRWHDLFLAYHGNGEWENCLQAIKKKQQAGGPSAWEWFHEAMVHWQLNQRDEALAKFHAALDAMDREDNRHAKLRGYQSEAAMVLGLPDPGLRVDQANTYFKQGTALEKAGQPDEAKEAFGKAIEQYEALAAGSPLVLSYTQRLIDLLKKCGRQAELEQVYRRAISARDSVQGNSPDLRLAHANQCNDLAFVLLSAGRQPEAEEFSRKAVDRKMALTVEFPEEPDYRFHLAHSYLGLATIVSRAGRESEAVDANRSAGSLFLPLAADVSGRANFRQWNAHALWQLGDAWLRLNRLDEAREAFEQSRATFEQLAKENPTNRFYRQEQAFSQRKLADAADRAGQTDETQKQLRSAMKAYEELVVEVPDFLFYRREQAAVQLRLAGVLAREGQLKEADEAYRSAIGTYDQLIAQSYDPDKRYVSSVLNGIAWPLVMGLQPPEGAVRLASAVAQRAVELNPTEGAFWSTLGMAHYRAGDWKAAAEAFEKTMALGFRNGTMQLFVAMAQWQLGNHEQARTQFNEACQWIDKHEAGNEGVHLLRKEAEDLIQKERAVLP